MSIRSVSEDSAAVEMLMTLQGTSPDRPAKPAHVEVSGKHLLSAHEMVCVLKRVSSMSLPLTPAVIISVCCAGFIRFSNQVWRVAVPFSGLIRTMATRNDPPILLVWSVTVVCVGAGAGVQTLYSRSLLELTRLL
jgi:hypothetical protein